LSACHAGQPEIMSNFNIWVNCIKQALHRQGVKVTDDLKIEVEEKGNFHQAYLEWPGYPVVFGEPALGEDNAMQALLDEVNNLTS
jgi:hypothetical protein